MGRGEEGGGNLGGGSDDWGFDGREFGDEGGIRVRGEVIPLNWEERVWLFIAAWCRILLIEEMWRLYLRRSSY